MTAVDDRAADPAARPAIDWDEAWRSLVIAWAPGGNDPEDPEEIEIGPVYDRGTSVMAKTVRDLIVGNPALREYVCAKLAALPGITIVDVRVLPLALLRDEIEMTMEHGRKPWLEEEDPSEHPT